MIGYSCFLVSSWNIAHQYGVLFGMKVCNKYSTTFRFPICPCTNSISSFDSFHSLDYKNKHYWLYCVSGLMKPRVEFWITNKNCKNINKLVSYDSSIKWFEQPNQSHQNNNTDWLLLNFNFWLQPLPPVRARKSFLIGGLGVTPQPPPPTKTTPRSDENC